MNIFKDTPIFSFMSGDMIPAEKDVVLTIRDTRNETIDTAQGRKKKTVVIFQETKLPLILNVTNARQLAKLYGPETADWQGKRVALYRETVRVRPTAPAGKPSNGQGDPAAVDAGNKELGLP